MLTNEINTFYTYLQSQQNAQQYLAACYRQLEFDNASVKSFENCNPFMHYLDHGVRFYDNGKRLEPLLQPMLFLRHGPFNQSKPADSASGISRINSYIGTRCINKKAQKKRLHIHGGRSEDSA